MKVINKKINKKLKYSWRNEISKMQILLINNVV